MSKPNARHLICSLLLVLGVGFVGAAPGCRVIRFFFPSDQIELASSPSEEFKAPVAIDSSAIRGLEVRLWVVDDTEWSAARLLNAYVDEPVAAGGAMDPGARGGWSDWGFRVIALPIGEVEGFLGGLRPVQPTNVQWLGEFARWRAIVRAGALGTERVRVGDLSVRIAQGRPRLIARSWVEPMLSADDVVPALRLDLGMQIETSKKRAMFGLDSTVHERMIEDEGPLIDELLLSLRLDGSHALVIVGEAPDTDWSQLPELEPILPDIDSDADPAENPHGPQPPQEQEQEQTKPVSQSPSSPARRVTPPGHAPDGPGEPMGKTLGELMLTSPGSRMPRVNESRVIPKRVIVVLIPRIEGGFRLLPSAGSSANRGGSE